MCRIQQVLRKQFGSTLATAFVIVTAVQFHLPFYMSRTLPNTFALAVLGFAIADWLEAWHPKRLVALLAFVTVSTARCACQPCNALTAKHLCSYCPGICHS